MSFKIFKTKKTRVSNLLTLDNNKVEATVEPQLKKDFARLEESSIEDAFEELFGDAGETIPPEEQKKAQRPVGKDDVQMDQTLSDDVLEKREYAGPTVRLQ